MPYYVYVVRLRDDVKNDPRFRRENPGMDVCKPCYYVGQSFHQPEERFRQHKEGYKASKYVRKFGAYLSKRKYENLNPLPDRKQAEEMERTLAEQLKNKGFGVWTN